MLALRKSRKALSVFARLRLLIHAGLCLAGWMATVVLPLHAGEANGLDDQKETVIELKDAVTVLNENSRFQINLLLADFPTEMITLPIPVQELKNLTNASQKSIADLLEHASNYTAAVSNGVFTLLPRGDASNALSYILPRFSVEQTNLFSALFALCRSVPFRLESSSPTPVRREVAPDLRFGYPHWATEEIPLVNLSVTNTSVWGVLNTLVNSSKKAYWIAYPFWDQPLKPTRTKPSGTGFEIHHTGESRSGWILSGKHPISVFPLGEAAHLLNECSPFQVNVEIRDLPQRSLAVPVTRSRGMERLTNASASFLQVLFRQVPECDVLESGRILTLIPRKERDNPLNPLNYLLPEFTVEHTNLFWALYALACAIPPEMGLEIREPVVVRRDHRPEIVDSEHWKVADMPIVTASFTNQTVREILSALVNPHRKAYWIAWPLHDEMALREAVQIAPGGLMPDQATFLRFERAMTKALQVGGKTNVMSVGIYHAMENRHVSLPLGK